MLFLDLADPVDPQLLYTLILTHKAGLREAIQGLAAEHFAGMPGAFAKQKGAVIFLLFEGALIEAQNFRDTWPIVAARKEVNSLLTAES